MREAKSDADCADCLCRCCARSECNDSYNEQVDIDRDYCQGCNGCNGYVIENAEDCPRGQWLPDETDNGCSDMTNFTEEQERFALALEQANATINYLNEEKEKAINEIEKRRAFNLKCDGQPEWLRKGIDVGLNTALDILKGKAGDQE